MGGDDQLDGAASLSSNGGSSWSTPSLPAGTPELDGASCADVNHCVAVGRGAIVSTSNGGSTWTLSALPTAETTMIGVSCSTTTMCVAAGVTADPTGAFNGALLRSSDGGATWSQETEPPGAGGMGAVACPTPSTCIAVGTSVLVSHDGGVTWNQVGVPNGIQQLMSISCSSATTCVAIGPNIGAAVGKTGGAEAIITTDAGASWSPDALPVGTATLDQISSAGSACFASGQATSSGAQAPYFSSPDGGHTWAPQSSVAPQGVSMIAGLSCASASHCTVVGRQSGGGAVASATMDGSTWSSTMMNRFSALPASMMSAS